MAKCGVCWEIYDEGAECLRLLPCKNIICVSCLKELRKEIGRIKCPFCRKRHKIPGTQMENLPTNQQALKNTTLQTNKIYTLPSSAEAPRIDIGICEIHGTSSFSVIYGVIEGTEQKFCETCLNQISNITSQHQLENQTEPNRNCQHFKNRQEYNSTRSIAMGRENESNGEMLISYEEELEPCHSWQATNSCLVENIEHPNRTTKTQTIRIFKRLVFILCSPIIISVGLLVALVTIPICVTLCPFCTIYFFFRCRCCHLYDETYHCILNIISRIFDRYAYLITRLFCCDVEDYDSRINQTCQIVALGVSLIVIGLYLAGLISGLVAFFLGSLVLWA